MAEDGELEPLPLGGELRPFQRAGVLYVLQQRRTFLADEQGLGKTVQALAALEADAAYPAVVVCPASLKLTWEREAAKWVPHRRTAVLAGRSARGWDRANADQADIVILNYDIVGGHVARLGERGLAAAVFDESHYCKEPRAKRTKACLSLARRVTPGGLKLALTGTPILNRPKELVSQLKLIGRLEDFGSGAAMTRRFRGSDALERMHWHLRAHCYVRRVKADVLPQLPPKRQVTIPVALANETEYRLAERNVVDWLRTQPLDLRELQAKVAAAMRNERLVQLNKLRQLAGRGKLGAALGWIEDFLESGEPLVVFADHIELQQALLERFPDAAHVLGADDTSARDANVVAFQREDGPQLIVCSLRAAGQGLTLTRASNVAFLELDWTPARLAQAEDRCHRIGQASAVTAWYLLAPDTIDTTMSELLEQKRGVIGAVTDGHQVESESLVEAVVRDLQDRVEAESRTGRRAA
jgi:SNF2 family DNA or RNA helicase